MGKALAAWLMVAGAVAAPATSPREVVQSAVARVIIAIQEADLHRPDAEPGSPKHLEERVEIRRVARGLFDFEEMARRTLSRHWAGRSAEEQAEFVKLFTDLLERTYIGRIESYAGEKILYVGESIDARYATVRSKIVTRRKTETALDYRLHLLDGRWKVYDVLLDGVSFVSTYRSEFNRIIQLSSYASLVDQLRKKRVETAPASDRSARPLAVPVAGRQ
jgi:phospholipid transport system substrate-binding protein